MQSSQRLLIFIHIPKSAGTSVNSFLKKCSPFGLSHVESVLGSNFFNTTDYEWLSGHLPRWAFAQSLSFESRNIEYFSCVRSPLQRLISNLNWEFAKASRRTNSLTQSHGAWDVASDGILNVDFGSRKSVIQYLENSRGIIDVTSSALLNISIDRHAPANARISDDFIELTLRKYEYIGSEASIHNLNESFGFYKSNYDIDIFENVSEKIIDESIFYSGELDDYLSDALELEKRVYEWVRKIFRAPPIIHTFHRSLAEVHEGNFDENAYLIHNHDVAEAVQTGIFADGFEHFQKYGQYENRRQLFIPARC